MKVFQMIFPFFFVLFLLHFCSADGHYSNKHLSEQQKLEKYRSIESLNDEIEREIVRRKMNEELIRIRRDGKADKTQAVEKTLKNLHWKAHLKTQANGILTLKKISRVFFPSNL